MEGNSSEQIEDDLSDVENYVRRCSSTGSSAVLFFFRRNYRVLAVEDLILWLHLYLELVAEKDIIGRQIPKSRSSDQRKE